MKPLLPLILLCAGTLLARADESCSANNFHSDGMTSYAESRAAPPLRIGKLH